MQSRSIYQFNNSWPMTGLCVCVCVCVCDYAQECVFGEEETGLGFGGMVAVHVVVGVKGA